MAATQRIVLTGSGAICAAGRSPAEIWQALQSGRSAIGPIAQWDTTGWSRSVAGEIRDLQPGKLLGDRKILKFIRRSDVLGLYAASRAIETSGFAAWRDALGEAAATEYNDRTGVFVGSGGGSYDSQYDYFPLMTAAAGSLQEFGRQLPEAVNPMWLLRALPNNVLCHVGIKYNLKGTNACITNHSTSGMLAIIEAAGALRTAEGIDVTCVQIAGLVARRILCYVEAGAELERGQRFGFIRFGSRVDVYLPPSARPRVAVGDKVRATETIIAELD